MCVTPQNIFLSPYDIAKMLYIVLNLTAANVDEDPNVAKESELVLSMEPYEVM
jgi:hypothetical protein